MKKQLYFFFFLTFSMININAQNFVLGKVVSEDDIELSGVMITNIFTREQAFTDNKGNFMIRAKSGEEIRFTRIRYERESVKINDNHFQYSLLVKMKAIPIEIEEVEISYRPTGDLEMDMKHFRGNKQVEGLENEIENYISSESSLSVTQIRPGEFNQNAFAPKQQGLDVLSALAYGVSLFKKKKPILDTKEKSAFQQLVKNKMNTSYYENLGFSDFDIDRLIAYACERFDLEQKFIYNFNINSIEKYLKKALKDFKTSDELKVLHSK